MKSSPPQAQYAFFFFLPVYAGYVNLCIFLWVDSVCQLKLFFLKFLLQYVNELSLGSV